MCSTQVKRSYFRKNPRILTQSHIKDWIGDILVETKFDYKAAFRWYIIRDKWNDTHNINLSGIQGICEYCLAHGYLTRDHIIPKCRGGRKIAMVCECCNNLKGSLSLGRWLNTLPCYAPQQWVIPYWFKDFL